MRQFLMSAAIVMSVGCGADSGSSGSSDGAAPLLSIPNSAGTAAGVTEKSKDRGPTPESPALRQLIGRANAAVVAGRHAVAIEALSQAIGTTPEDARLFRMRADVYVLQREMANARADYSTAVRLAPDNAEILNVRGYFLMSQGLSTDAATDFSEAIRLDPGFAAPWNNRGLISLAAEHYQDAVRDFTSAIEIHREFPDAWNNRAYASMKLGQHASALSDVQQALRLKEDYPTAWNNCGLIHMQMNQFAEAEKAFNRLIELAPMDARWLNHRRAALLKQEKFAEAQQDAIQIEWLAGLSLRTQQTTARPSEPGAWISRGEYLMKYHEYGAAIQDFSRALQLSPGNAQALAGRALALLHTGDLDRAIQDCDESIVAAATPDTYSVRGDIWMSLRNYDQAVSDYEMAQRFDDRVAEAYELRAAMHRDAGDTDRAGADLQKAAEIRAALNGTPGQRAEAQQPPPEFPETTN